MNFGYIEEKSHRIFADCSDFPPLRNNTHTHPHPHTNTCVPRGRTWCRSHVPNIQEKPFRSRRSPPSHRRERSCGRDSPSELDICNSKSLSPYRRTDDVRDVCNSISFRRRSKCRFPSQDDFLRLFPVVASFPIARDSRTGRDAKDSVNRDKRRRGSLERRRTMDTEEKK